MNLNNWYLNLFGLFVLAQFYNFFSIFRFHIFLTLLLVIVLGILLGLYFSLNGSEFIVPDLSVNKLKSSYVSTSSSLNTLGVTTADSIPSSSSSGHNHLISYKIYQDLVNIINRQAVSSSSSSRSQTSSFRSSLNELSTNVNSTTVKQQNRPFDTPMFKYKKQFSVSLDDLDEELDDDTKETRSLVLNDFESNQFSLSGNEEFVDDNESRSNSKFETYLDDLMELAVRDFIIQWLGPIIWEKDKFALMTRLELKTWLESLRKLFRRLDYVKLVSRDIIYLFHHHFLNFKRYPNVSKSFRLNYYEMDANRERDHLRNIVEILMLNTFKDKYYFQNDALRHLLREVLVNRILYPSIELICDPDYINQKIIDFIVSRENLRNSLDTKYSNLPNYEEFIRLIKSTNNMDELKQIHYKIMNEIMQATIVNEFKNTKSTSEQGNDSNNPSVNNGVVRLGSSSFFASFSASEANEAIQNAYMSASPSSASIKSSNSSDKNTKAEMLRSRNLKIYIKQLRQAKLLCERRMSRLKSQQTVQPDRDRKRTNSTFYDDDANDYDFESRLKNRKILPIDVILNSSKGQSTFLKFLEHDGSDRLLRFWIDVEKLKKINANKKYELANKIYEVYLNTYDSPVRDEVGRGLNKSMQMFLIGNYTDDGFYKAQEKIKAVLENDHYPTFVASELYEKVFKELKDNEIKEAANKSTIQMKKFDSVASLDAKIQHQKESRKSISSGNQVDTLRERLQMKTSALNAIKSNGYQQIDSKLVELLEKEIQSLKVDITSIESHIQNTEMWCENLGKWKAQVTGTRLGQVNTDPSANVENSLLFEIKVELQKSNENLTSSLNRFKHGWTIERTFKQFETLHESLAELIPINLRNNLKKIPSILKRVKSNQDQDRLKEVVPILNEYLRVVSQDEWLAMSEALYTFLCPSPDYFRRMSIQNNPSASDERFSLGNIFKSIKLKEKSEDDYLDSLFSESYLKNIDNDSIAQPFYNLFEEVFEMKGIKKPIRKSLIIFVQLTYGSNINRMIREKIYSFLSDDSLSLYTKQVKESFWKLDDASNEYNLIQHQVVNKTNDEKIRTKKIAQQKLLNSIPDFLSKLVGDRHTNNGIVKLFDMFQDKKLNKHLLYNILDMLMMHIFPESSEMLKNQSFNRN